MVANNELGTIQQIEEIGSIAQQNKILFHVDAVQAIGHTRISIKKQKINALSISGHKLGGPKGIGALYISNHIMLEALINGGSQEHGVRAGTQNIAGIIGLTEALKLRTKNIENESTYILELRNYFIYELKKIFPSLKINGGVGAYLPNIINITFPATCEKKLLLILQMFNIYASSGAACCSGKNYKSHVLKAIGKSDREIDNSIRFSLSHQTKRDDLTYVIDVLKNFKNSIRL